MSLTKMQSFGSHFKKDSFSDRFCDDLSEVILQFLSLKDKFRYECVSKQFQRTVFQRHYNLVDEVYMFSRTQLTTILKKLPNIRSLDQKRFDRFNGINDSFIDLIVKYCNNLNEIHCDFSGISDKIEENFIKKFGSQIKSIFVKNSDFERLEGLHNSMANIKRVNYLSFAWKQSPLPHGFQSFFIPFLENVCYLKNMKRISIRLFKNDSNQQMKDLQTFVENNKSITHLCLLFDIMDTNFTNFVFKQISNLNNLIELEIYEIKEFSAEFKQIAVNCPQLKSLIINLISNEDSQIESILIQLKIFNSLQRLCINCIEYYSGIEIILNNCLKEMKNLTHLKLGFPTFPSVLLNECLFTDFDKCLPKLQFLFIKNSVEATEETAVILSRFSNLESVVLFASNQSISNLIENKVKKNCPRIKFWKFNQTN